MPPSNYALSDEVNSKKGNPFWNGSLNRTLVHLPRRSVWSRLEDIHEKRSEGRKSLAQLLAEMRDAKVNLTLLAIRFHAALLWANLESVKPPLTEPSHATKRLSLSQTDSH